MIKPLINRPTRAILVLVMAISLLSGTLVSHAQAGPDLTESYTWEPYALTFHYPDGWTTLVKEQSVSVRPADRDVTDGFGPELVFFEVETTGTTSEDLRAAAHTIANEINGTVESLHISTLERHTVMTGSLVWDTPDASGQLMLIVIDPATVLGMAYIVRGADNDQYQPALEAMIGSVTFDLASRVQPKESSVSVTSVQLAQSYTWDLAGLTFYTPADWKTDLVVAGGRDTLVMYPADSTANDYPTMRAALFDNPSNINMRNVIDSITSDYDLIDGPVETVVAGYAADGYDFRKQGDEPLSMRLIVIPIEERDMAALILFETYQNDWAVFRPVVSAMISSIEAVYASRAAGITLVANTTARPDQPRLPLAQDDSSPYTWEQYNITFTLPIGWVASEGSGQDYDLALVSPSVMETGNGPFITLLGMPMLGASPDDLVTAIEPITDQLEIEATSPYEIAGIENAVGVDYTDDEGSTYHFILVPYDDRGDVIYLQASGPTEDEETVLAVLNSMVIDTLTADWDEVDAAWQTSLAETGLLTVGDPDAPVRMKEYFSFTCGHCVRYSRSIERLIALDVANGDLLLDLIPLEGDEFATLAAHATLCATEQGKGYTAHELLIQGYVDEGYSVAYTEDGINDILGDLGLDMDDLNACIAEQRYGDLLKQYDLEFTDQGMTGTPTMAFGVDGEPAAPILLPDGQVWGGALPLQWVMDIVDNYINDGIKPADFFNQQQ